VSVRAALCGAVLNQHLEIWIGTSAVGAQLIARCQHVYPVC
jgi:hypothetical protein